MARCTVTQGSCADGAGAPPLSVYRRRRPQQTVLYQVVQGNLETWIVHRQDPEGIEGGVAAYIERDLRGYLECGILACGFARARCASCGHDTLIAYSCKSRGACPSCNTRHMVKTAAHLVDHVFPQVPVRQWVLSLPKRLRYFLQQDPALCRRVQRLFLQVIEAELIKTSPGAEATARFGAVSFIQRFGGALNAHIHFHCCVIDGVFSVTGDGVQFFEASHLNAAAIDAVQRKARQRILKLFARRGLLSAEAAQLMGEWDHNGGFSLDASVRIEASDRAGLERLLRYCARPPLSGARLEWVTEGEQLIYRLAKPRPDGQTVVRLTPLELLDRLAALIPPPRRHRHGYHGVLAPNAAWRGAVTALAGQPIAPPGEPADASSPPSPAEPAEPPPPPTPASTPTRPKRPSVYTWALLLARIYEILPLDCPQCGEPMRIIAFITEAPVIESILRCLGEPTEPPPVAPARGPPIDEADIDQTPRYDLTDPEPIPDDEFDQRISW
jgi:hypothetical protein